MTTSYLRHQSPWLQMIVFTGITVGCILVYSLAVMGWVLPHLTGLTMFELQKGDLSNPRLLMVLKTVQLGYTLTAFALPAWLFFYLSDPRPMVYAGMKAPFRGKAFAIALGTLFCAMPVVGVLNDWNQALHFGSMDKALRDVQEQAEAMTRSMLTMSGWGSLAFNLLLIAVVPAIAEEWLFRGALQRLLIRLSRPWIGILLAAVFFSLAHGEMLGFLPRVALGVVLGLVYYLSGNLWYAIGLHMVNNAAQVILVFLFQHQYIQYDIMQDQPTPLLAGVIGLLMTVALFLALWRVSPRPAAAAASHPTHPEP